MKVNREFVEGSFHAHQVPLDVPGWKKYGAEKGGETSCMNVNGILLDQVVVDNSRSLRISSPDEHVSNKLDDVFNHTDRDFQWDEFSHAKGVESSRFFPSVPTTASFKVTRSPVVLASFPVTRVSWVSFTP